MRKIKVKGFTLIELIVVIAIIGVLAAILIPTMMGYVKKSKRTADVASAKNIHTDVLDLILEDEDASDSFYDKTGITKVTRHDSITNKDYDLVLVAYLNGQSSAESSGNVWKEYTSQQQEFCDKFNKRLDYKSSNTNVKIKIKSHGDNGDNYNRWFVGYREDEPYTVEVWVGDGRTGAGGDPQMCLYTQISKSSDD